VSKRSLGILFSVVFLDNLGFAIVFPYLLFYVESMGGNVFIYGLLLRSTEDSVKIIHNKIQILFSTLLDAPRNSKAKIS